MSAIVEFPNWNTVAYVDDQGQWTSPMKGVAALLTHVCERDMLETNYVGYTFAKLVAEKFEGVIVEHTPPKIRQTPKDELPPVY